MGSSKVVPVSIKTTDKLYLPTTRAHVLLPLEPNASIQEMTRSIINGVDGDERTCDSKCIENEINTASHMFKDACKDIERRQMTRAVVTVVAPLHTQHCIVHRTIWNLSSPIRMVDVYCQHVANDLGLGSMNGHVFGREMKKEVQRLRDNMNDATLVDTSAQGIILQDATIGDGKNRNTRRWPVIVKAEVAHAMKQALQRCPFGEEDAVLEQLQLTNPDTVNHEIRHADMEDVVVG